LGFFFADRDLACRLRRFGGEVLDLDPESRGDFGITRSSSEIWSALAMAASVRTSPVFDPFSISEIKP
jgi:hypothetical protein